MNKKKCPKCNHVMTFVRDSGGVQYNCSNCGGSLLNYYSLKKRKVNEATKLKIFSAFQQNKVPNSAYHCPDCERQMNHFTVIDEKETISLDSCFSCKNIWFDEEELLKIGGNETLPIKEEKEILKPETLLAMAKADLELNRLVYNEKENNESQGIPNNPIKLVLTILGLPVEENENREWFQAKTTYLFAFIFILVFIVSVISLAQLTRNFAFIPIDPFGFFGLPIITSMFMHSGLMHLLGNLYFWIIFSDDIESKLGIVKFLIIAFFSHFVGLFIHGLMTSRPETPLVGASGAISGIMMSYLIFFPRNKIKILYRVLFYFRFFTIKAYYYIPFWLLLQFLQANLYEGSVAHWAHIGGALTGLTIALIFKAFEKKVEIESESVIID